MDTDLPAPLVQQLSEARGGQLAPGLARELRRGGRGGRACVCAFARCVSQESLRVKG